MNILSAQFSNDDGTSVTLHTSTNGAVCVQLTGEDNSGGFRSEYLEWVAAGGATAKKPVIPVNYFQAAERHVAKFFSVTALLQMKVWLDSGDIALRPKLAATLQWGDAVARESFAGSSDFSNPPYDFAEIAAEVLKP